MPRMPAPSAAPREPAPVVADAQLDAVAGQRAQAAASHVVGAGVPGGVGQALLGDPVEDQLGRPGPASGRSVSSWPAHRQAVRR